MKIATESWKRPILQIKDQQEKQKAKRKKWKMLAGEQEGPHLVPEFSNGAGFRIPVFRMIFNPDTTTKETRTALQQLQGFCMVATLCKLAIVEKHREIMHKTRKKKRRRGEK